MNLQFFLCAQATPDDDVQVLDSFESLDQAIDCLEELQRLLPDQNFWVGSVPYKPPADSIPEPLVL